MKLSSLIWFAKFIIYKNIISILLFGLLYYLAYYYLESDAAYHRTFEHKYSLYDMLYHSAETQTFVGYEEHDHGHYITQTLMKLQLFFDKIF